MRPRALAAIFAALLLLGPAHAAAAPSLHVGALRVGGDLSVALLEVVAPGPVTATAPTGAVRWHGGALAIPLAFVPDGVQHLDVSLEAGGQRGVVRLEYYPPSYYASIGVDQRGVLLLVTDLPRIPAGLAVWPPFAAIVPPGLSLAAHVAEWQADRAAGSVPTVGLDLDAAILALFHQYDARNDASRGDVCSGRLSGIETYREMSRGECWAWCTGYALMTRGFLRSAGIPARMITLRPQTSGGPGGLLVESSEAHDTVEVWDGDHWAWLGPTSRVLRVTLDDGPSLSLGDFLRARVDPWARPHLRVTFEADGAWRTDAYDRLPEQLLAFFDRYFTLDKTIDIHDAGMG